MDDQLFFSFDIPEYLQGTIYEHAMNFVLVLFKYKFFLLSWKFLSLEFVYSIDLPSQSARTILTV